MNKQEAIEAVYKIENAIDKQFKAKHSYKNKGRLYNDPFSAEEKRELKYLANCLLTYIEIGKNTSVVKAKINEHWKDILIAAGFRDTDLDQVILEIKNLIKIDDNNFQITIPHNVLQWLQDKGFIEEATAKPITWKTEREGINKRVLWELITHVTIRGVLGKDEAARKVKFIFIDEKGKSINMDTYSPREPKNKNYRLKDLQDFLATL